MKRWKQGLRHANQLQHLAHAQDDLDLIPPHVKLGVRVLECLGGASAAEHMNTL